MIQGKWAWGGGGVGDRSQVKSVIALTSYVGSICSLTLKERPELTLSKRQGNSAPTRRSYKD